MEQATHTACVYLSQVWSLELESTSEVQVRTSSLVHRYLAVPLCVTFPWPVSVEVRLSVSSFSKNTSPVGRDLLRRPNLLITSQRKGLLQLDLVALICTFQSQGG